MQKFQGQDVFKIQTSIKTPHKIDILLRDALMEFIYTRTPTSDYLISRNDAEYLAHHPDKKEETIYQIKSQIELAEQIVHSLIFVE